MRFIATFCLSVLHFTLFSQQNISFLQGAKGVSMANGNVLTKDIFALSSNPSGIAFLQTAELALFSEQRFLQTDLLQIHGLVAIPTKIGAFGVSVQSFGVREFQEQKIGLSYAKKLAENFALAVQLGYLNQRISEYGQHGTLTASVGFQVQIVPNFWAGAAVFNPFFQKTTENLTTPLLEIGFSYLFFEKLTLAAATKKTLENPLSTHLGIDYRIIKPLSFRVGVQTAPVQNTFGVGLHLQRFDLDFAFVRHLYLGWTPAFSLKYRFKGNS